MQNTTVKVEGLRELLRATDAAGKETKKLVRDKLRTVAKPVLDAARPKLARYDARSAAKLGISIRKVGTVSVEQRMRRTTGAHPQFGALQMSKVLMPALSENADQVLHEFDRAVDEIEDNFKRG
jgi:hypothetical protein